MIPQSESGSQEGLTQAGVSGGTISITDAANQKQDVATLNRDTSSTNSTVGKNPDLANVLSEQADMMAAAQAAGEAVARTVGGYCRQQAEGCANRVEEGGSGLPKRSYRRQSRGHRRGASRC
ncbi:hypothetical protein OJJOAM_003422 [Cupriavidus sp. H18C1]|uniref:hypothetical protein n=1 Tax=Cupriavidus sp. H18C1 TaxID=3241601 RepID=UPI003BB88B09